MVLQGKPSKQNIQFFQPSSAIERLRKGGEVERSLKGGKFNDY